jgi:hypothetical protein
LFSEQHGAGKVCVALAQTGYLATASRQVTGFEYVVTIDNTQLFRKKK